MNPIALTGIVELAKKLIPDKDKLAELEAEVKQAQNALDQLILNTTTTPWVDALVKLLYAAERFIRPLGAAAMTAFGLYAHLKGLNIDPMTHGLIDGAFPAWGASRHVHQNNRIKKDKKDVARPSGRLYGSK